jgi:protein-tyrosine phosphatase
MPVKNKHDPAGLYRHMTKPKVTTDTKREGNKTTRIVRANGRVRYVYVTEATYSHFDCSRIEPGLYQGARPNQYPFFADAVINLEDTLVLNYKPDKLLGYLWAPIKDKPEAKPTIAWLDQIVDALISWRYREWSVLVHCQAGFSRSSLILAAFLIKKENLSCDAALDKLRACREGVRPNSGFLELLKEYEALLHPLIAKEILPMRE